MADRGRFAREARENRGDRDIYEWDPGVAPGKRSLTGGLGDLDDDEILATVLSHMLRSDEHSDRLSEVSADWTRNHGDGYFQILGDEHFDGGPNRSPTDIMEEMLEQLFFSDADTTAFLETLTQVLTPAQLTRMYDMLDGVLFNTFRALLAAPEIDTARLMAETEAARPAEVARALESPTMLTNIVEKTSGGSANPVLIAVIRRGTATGSRFAVPESLSSVLHPLLDQFILAGTDVAGVGGAFGARWDLDVRARDGKWTTTALKRIHEQFLRLPAGDVSGTGIGYLAAAEGSGGYFGLGIGVGEEAEDWEDRNEKKSGRRRRSDRKYITGTWLTEAAQAGTQVVQVNDAGLFTVGEAITIGSEEHTVEAVQGAELRLASALAADQAQETAVSAKDGNLRTVEWLDVVIRHEVGHAIDANVVDTTELTESIAGWVMLNSFDEWIEHMANPWATTDGSVLTDKDIQDIRDHVNETVSAPGGNLKRGINRRHAVRRYWDSGVTALDAVRHCLERGEEWYWSPEYVHSEGGRRFAFNTWYGSFQICKDEVYTHRVRSFSVFSQPEFFAELYAVFYEEAGLPDVSDDQLGRLIPVASWREWMRKNVHERNLAPQQATAAGHTEPTTGMKTGRIK